MNYDDYGKIPPQDQDIERAILGAIIKSPESLEKVIELISEETFYKDANKTIFNVVYELFKEGKQVDLLTVTDRLRKKDKLDLIGGPFYITELSGGKFIPESLLDNYCGILKQFQLQRFFIEFCHKEINLAYSKEDVSVMLNLFAEAQEKIDNILEFGSKVRSLMKNIDIVIDQANERTMQVRKGEIVGITTGLLDLNRKLTWRIEDLIIVAARPGMGKTAMCLKYAKAAAEKGNHVRIYSLEMSDISLTERILLSESDIPADKFRDGYMSNDDLKSLEVSAKKLQNLNIWIDDKPARTVTSISSTAKKYHRTGQCDMIIIDYLQLTEPETEGSTNDKIGKITRTLKKIAKELKIPVILLSQLNRSVEQRVDKIPQLSDLRDSGNIEQDADKVLFLYRPEYYGKMQDEDGESTEGIGVCIIAKNRQGACGAVKFRYNESLTKIFDDNPYTEDITKHDDLPF